MLRNRGAWSYSRRVLPVPTPDPLTPDAAYCAEIRAKAGAGPVITLNLLRFKADGGRERFEEYGRISSPLLEKARADILYLGTGGPLVAGSEEWDLVAVVRFQNIDRFLAMLTDPTYQSEGRRLREASLERVLWMVTYPV